jgi:hypothetical protein
MYGKMDDVSTLQDVPISSPEKIDESKRILFFPEMFYIFCI